MSATETWQQRHAEIERLVLRLEAGCAQREGIDVFSPGWRDEYLELKREQSARAAEIDVLIGTPHVDDAIVQMEQQFIEEADDAS